MYKCKECDDQMKTFYVSEHCRLSWQVIKTRLGKCWEDPTEEIIAGHINEFVVKNDTDFVCYRFL